MTFGHRRLVLGIAFVLGSRSLAAQDTNLATADTSTARNPTPASPTSPSYRSPGRFTRLPPGHLHPVPKLAVCVLHVDSHARDTTRVAEAEAVTVNRQTDVNVTGV